MAEGRRNFKRALLISVGIIAAAAVASVLALFYLSGDLKTQSEKIVSDKAMIAQQTAIVNTLANLKSDAAAAVPYLAAMNQLLPTHDDLIGFPQWVNSVAQEHGISATFTFTGKNTGVSASAPASDSFSLGLTGSAAGIAAFLGDFEMEAEKFLLAIDSFDLTVAGSGYTLSAQGRVFSRG